MTLRSSMEQTTFIFLIALSITKAVPLHRAERQVIDFDDPAASNLTANEVCFSDNEIYQRGDIMPNPGPCEECKCEPPSIVCNMMKCPKNSGCRTIQRANHCCPDYKCECDHNGEIYSNGERLDTPDEPCQVCYCKGGEVMCTSITCYHRDDCEPQLVAGQCCPKYDHCPLRDMPSASENDERQINKNKTYVNSPKREMQPWLLTKSVFINTKATLTTQRNIEEFTTDKSPAEQTEVIISDWLAERKTTTEGELENNEARDEQTTNTLDTTTGVNSNIIGQDKEETSITNEEPTTIDTTAQSINSEQEKENEEMENQTDFEMNTDTTITTTGNPSMSKNNSDNAVVSTEDATNIQDLETTESPTIETTTTSQKEIEEEEVTYTTGIEDFNEKRKENEDFNVTTKQTEPTTTSMHPTERTAEDETEDPPGVYLPDFDIPLQNGKSTNEKRSGVKYEGSAEEPLDEENDTDSILHEELSEDFENIETTKFSDHTVVHTTPITLKEPIGEEVNKKSAEKENEIKDNFTVVKTENDVSVVEKQTEEPAETTTIEYNTVATTLLNNEHIEETTTEDDKSEVKQTEIVSTTLFEDSLLVKVDENQSELEKTLPNSVSDSTDLVPKDDSIKEFDVTLKDMETTTSKVDDTTTTKTEEINHSLKEVLTKEDTNQSELEKDSVEEISNKVKKNSEEFETKASNEEEGEDNQEPPVIELNNQLPFLQLGGHGSSESSTSETYSSEVKETGVKTVDANQPSLRTVPESHSTDTSTHIALTQGDLKILAEYIINEKIKPIGHPSKNESSHYMPTEWLKGNLTSDVKIASILTAANISIGIMNKTNIESKIKSLDDVGHLMNVGKNGEDKESNSKTEPMLEKDDEKSSTDKVDVHQENSKESEPNKNTDSSTISTKLSLITEDSALEQKDKDNQSLKNNPETNTEKINLETEIFEGVTTTYSESVNLTKETTDKSSTEEVITTIIPEISAEEVQTSTILYNSEETPEVTDPKDVSVSRKVAIPEMESLVKEPYSVKLEDNDITIVRDFLKKHMVFP